MKNMLQLKNTQSFIKLNQVKSILQTKPQNNIKSNGLKLDSFQNKKQTLKLTKAQSYEDFNSYMDGFCKSYFRDSKESRFEFVNNIRNKGINFYSKLYKGMMTVVPQHTEILKNKNGKVVGGFSAIISGQELHISSLFLDKEVSSGKIALGFLKKIKELAVKNDCKIITCETDKSKKIVLKTFEKAGMKKNKGLFLKRMSCSVDDFGAKYFNK